MPVQYKGLTVAQLRQCAQEHKVKAPSKAKKDELIAKLAGAKAPCKEAPKVEKAKAARPRAEKVPAKEKGLTHAELKDCARANKVEFTSRIKKSDLQARLDEQGVDCAGKPRLPVVEEEAPAAVEPLPTLEPQFVSQTRLAAPKIVQLRDNIEELDAQDQRDYAALSHAEKDAIRQQHVRFLLDKKREAELDAFSGLQGHFLFSNASSGGIGTVEMASALASTGDYVLIDVQLSSERASARIGGREVAYAHYAMVPDPEDDEKMVRESNPSVVVLPLRPDELNYNRMLLLSDQGRDYGKAPIKKGEDVSSAKRELLKTLVLGLFNSQANAEFAYARFIAVDYNFKEGIDVMHVRYAHILEPQLTLGDALQAIGRVIRRCGHRYQPFENGWRVQVYTYVTRFGKQLLELRARDQVADSKDEIVKREQTEIMYANSITRSIQPCLEFDVPALKEKEPRLRYNTLPQLSALVDWLGAHPEQIAPQLDKILQMVGKPFVDILYEGELQGTITYETARLLRHKHNELMDLLQEYLPLGATKNVRFKEQAPRGKPQPRLPAWEEKPPHETKRPLGSVAQCAFIGESIGGSTEPELAGLLDLCRNVVEGAELTVEQQSAVEDLAEAVQRMPQNVEQCGALRELQVPDADVISACEGILDRGVPLTLDQREYVEQVLRSVRGEVQPVFAEPFQPTEVAQAETPQDKCTTLMAARGVTEENIDATLASPNLLGRARAAVEACKALLMGEPMPPMGGQAVEEELMDLATQSDPTLQRCQASMPTLAQYTSNPTLLSYLQKCEELVNNPYAELSQQERDTIAEIADAVQELTSDTGMCTSLLNDLQIPIDANAEQLQQMGLEDEKLSLATSCLKLAHQFDLIDSATRRALANYVSEIITEF